MKYFKISAVLAAISLVCALIIAGMNLLTAPVISKNQAETELKTIQKIFADYDEEKSQVVAGSDEKINKKIIATDKNGKLLGYIYNVSGKNAYGTITLMVAIKDDNLYQVEFVTNEQSFASTVDGHLSSNYPSSKKSTIELGFYSDSNSQAVGELTEDEVDDVNVKCGATYGAKLIKELIQVAFEDYNKISFR